MSLNVTQNSVNAIINVTQSNIEATLTVTQEVNSYLLKATQENKVTNINPVINTSSDISGQIPSSSLEDVTAVGSSSSRTIQIPEGVNSDDAVNKSQLDQKLDNRLEGLVVGLSILEKDTIKQKLDIVNDKTYTHTQSTPSNFWICNHNLGKKVSATITDSAGSIVEGEVIILNNNSVQIKFNNSFWGYAYFN